MVPIIPMEDQEFLLFKQNLSRATTEDQSGMGLVKGNSTCATTNYLQEFPMMDFLILSILSLLPRCFQMAKPISADLYQVHRGLSGVLIKRLWVESQCPDCRPMVPEDHRPMEVPHPHLIIMIRSDQ